MSNKEAETNPTAGDEQGRTKCALTQKRKTSLNDRERKFLTSSAGWKSHFKVKYLSGGETGAAGIIIKLKQKVALTL